MGLISRVSSRTYRKNIEKRNQKMGNVKIAKSKVPEGLVKKRARFAKQAAARNEAKAVAKKNNLLKRREFVRLNKASIQMLRIADPFIAWGYPSVETIKKLVYIRGAVKVNGQRLKIKDNSEIEKSIGHLGINCVEQLIHEIYTVGDNFRDANNALYPIKLSCPRGGWNKVTNHFIEGGDFGNREQYINQLALKMN